MNHQGEKEWTELTGKKLRDWLDAPPVAECSKCGRKSWGTHMVGECCEMIQPDGSRCKGCFDLPENPE